MWVKEKVLLSYQGADMATEENPLEKIIDFFFQNLILFLLFLCCYEYFNRHKFQAQT